MSDTSNDSNGEDSDERLRDFFKVYDSDESSALAEEIQTISPGDIIMYYDERIVRGRKDCMKTTTVLKLTLDRKVKVYLDDYYPLNRDSQVKILYKLLKNGKYEPFTNGREMSFKKYRFKETNYFEGKKKVPSYKELQKQFRKKLAEEIKKNNNMRKRKKNDNNTHKIDTTTKRMRNDSSIDKMNTTTECDSIIESNKKFVVDSCVAIRNNDKKKSSLINQRRQCIIKLLQQNKLDAFKIKEKEMMLYYKQLVIMKQFLLKKELDFMKRSSSSKQRVPFERKSWMQYMDRMKDKLFRKRFRMSKDCFKKLCRKIIKGVGESEFKSERFLAEQCNRNSKIRNIMIAHKETSGGFICGELKLAIALRILAGGSYLDVSEIFNIDADSCYPILHKVTGEWIVHNDEFEINIEKYLDDKKAMNRTAKDFSDVTNGCIKKIIGSLDGWLVKIKCPSEHEVGSNDDDKIPNPGNYHCRKGFYALNVQVIVDKKKEFCGTQ